MVRVDSKGRIVIPSEVRERLGLRPGSEVAVSAEDDRVILEPEDEPERVVRELEALIDEAAANRERRRRAGEHEGSGLGLDDDPIAAEQREIVRRGATRDGSTERDDTE